MTVRLTRFTVAAAIILLLGPAIGVALILVRTSDDQKQSAEGLVLYQQQCASCHGVNLEGQPNWRRRNPDGSLRAPPHDETGHTWHHPDDQLFAMTKFGPAVLAPAGSGYQSSMPGFEDKLSDQQIRNILEAIKQYWPKNVRQRQAEITRAYSSE